MTNELLETQYTGQSRRSDVLHQSPETLIKGIKVFCVQFGFELNFLSSLLFYWEYMSFRDLQPRDFGSFYLGLFFPGRLDVRPGRVGGSVHPLSADWSSLGPTVRDPSVVHRLQSVSKYSRKLLCP